jgi:hypothetical protein
MTSTMKRLSLVVTAAALTVFAIILAVVLTNRGGAANVLTADDVNRQLAGAQPSTSVTYPPVTDGSTSTLRRTVLDGTAVTVVAFCDGATPGAATWSPMPGYRVDDVHQRTGNTVVQLWLESDVANDVVATVNCGANGHASLTEVEQIDDHGGSGHGGSGRG